MTLLPSALLLVLFSLGTLSAKVTLYQVAAPEPTATPFVSNGVSFTASPIGVGQDGKTTYVEEEILTEVVAIFSDFTSTIIPTPMTSTCKPSFYIFNGKANSLLIQDIVEEDAAGVLVQMSMTDPISTQLSDEFIHSCKFEGTTAGSCVDIVSGLAGIATTTYSGTLVPIYTLTAGAFARYNICSVFKLVGWLLGMWLAFWLFYSY